MYESKSTSGVTVAMMRAFVRLSENLNLSKTCTELGMTRQTVRRHITDLERIKGEALFDVTDRQYKLTPYGESCLEGAKTLLMDIDIWAGQSSLTKSSTGGLEASKFVDADGREFFSQQHPVSKIAQNGLPLMKQAFKAWGASETQIFHPEMDAVRVYTTLYRESPLGWVFVDVGRESAYSRWMGWDMARSAIGKLFNDDNLSDEFNEFIAGAYSRIYEEGGVRLDHLYAWLPKEGGDPLPVTFQRLLLGCVFPDGTPGLTVLVLITEQVEIDALPPESVPEIPKQLLMDTVPDIAA